MIMDKGSSNGKDFMMTHITDLSSDPMSNHRFSKALWNVFVRYKNRIINSSYGRVLQCSILLKVKESCSNLTTLH